MVIVLSDPTELAVLFLFFIKDLHKQLTKQYTTECNIRNFSWVFRSALLRDRTSNSFYDRCWKCKRCDLKQNPLIIIYCFRRFSFKDNSYCFYLVLVNNIIRNDELLVKKVIGWVDLNTTKCLCSYVFIYCIFKAMIS